VPVLNADGELRAIACSAPHRNRFGETSHAPGRPHGATARRRRYHGIELQQALPLPTPS